MTLKEYREKHKIGVMEMARRLNCSHTLLYMYETNKQPVSKIMTKLIFLVTEGEVDYSKQPKGDQNNG
jgi:hypothetical protein